ncbi:YggS family pyridoxal phosphate-dependent enzyme [Agathobaculum sp.]|uniref:YggS family pyridoxal phosphate-dependent enzyme n=1 Tax=Agathobaculum sp. TaxID=2048138 RepID=UPI002A80AB8C|nr:YggS family pyridoxal phosphate-dependent enzyme [Agathobaculum sp.]MDY3618080.1 YggS family pyridoxal phosphate-dependent enzyme [Agathobaculum sp.]
MTVQEKQELALRIRNVRERIERAAQAAGRDASEIHLVAATKMNDAERVKYAISCGIHIAGENRVQELLDKYDQHAYDGADLQFIGTLQTNKVKYLIGKVSLIQSVGSIRLGEAIAKEAAKHSLRQDILLEVNIGREEAKSGLLPEELDAAVCHLCENPALHIRGLMAIPPIADQTTKNLSYFHEMHQLFVDILTKKYDNVNMDYLSMGMTNDFETAIACGANMVRIGTAIFGARLYGAAQQKA